MYCGENTLVKWGDQEREASLIPCRSWGCKDCAPMRQRQLVAEAIGGNPNTFITLTKRRINNETPEEAAKLLSRAWRLVRLRAIRESARDVAKGKKPFGAPPPDGFQKNAAGVYPRQVTLPNNKLDFIAVFEKHLSGWPHIHILARSNWIAFEWLSAQMRAIIDSPHVRIERITSAKQCAGYCAKYCGKEPARFGTMKRYWQTTTYDRRPESAALSAKRARGGYEIEYRPIRAVVTSWEELGWQVSWISTRRAYCSLGSSP